MNYRLFIALIVSLEVSEAVLFGFEVQVMMGMENVLVLTLLIIDVVLNGFVIGLLGYLIGIHAVLKCKGMTTYEYIKSMRKKKENRVKPTEIEEKKSIENKPNSREVRKSIIKAVNKTVLENPCSFSVAKATSEEILHFTYQLREDNENDSLQLSIK